MSYSRNFGMRSFENIVRDGRFRVPVTGTPLFIGSPVTIDGDNAGRLKQAAAGAAPGPAAGVVVFEHIQYKGVDTALVTGYDAPFNQVPLGQYAQLVHGPGAKVWFKNTVDKVLYDGRVQTGGGLLDSALTLSSLKPGTGLAPVAGGKFGAVASGGTAWLTVEQVNPTTGLVEARFTF